MSASAKSPAVVMQNLQALSYALFQLLPGDSAAIFSAVCDKEEVKGGPNFKDLDGESMLLLLGIYLQNMLTAVLDAHENFELVKFAQEISNEATA
jgi:hypothetical protein